MGISPSPSGNAAKAVPMMELKACASAKENIRRQRCSCVSEFTLVQGGYTKVR
jgi:hypothetical protein